MHEFYDILDSRFPFFGVNHELTIQKIQFKRALTNYAMFQIPLALLLTLESIGPLYSLPLALAMHKEFPSFRASIGAVFAVAGIVLLSLQGRPN